MKEKKYVYWMFVLPVLILYVIFFIIPVGMCFSYSLLDWTGVGKNSTFVGLNNYVRLFQDRDYLNAFWFSTRYAVVTVILSNALAILVALWVTSKLKTQNFVRTCFFLPNIISGIVVGFVWAFLFNQASKTLYSLTGLSIFKIKWLSDPTNSFWATIVVSLWQSVGYYMLIYISGLNSIDRMFPSCDAAFADALYYHQSVFDAGGCVPIVRHECDADQRRAGPVDGRSGSGRIQRFVQQQQNGLRIG